ncbi:hypothetical protein GLP24_08545 [Photobacterium carnosum]|uniref:hypothetical protein n=1 Tax=Photobacterium carnosum TaxID=2023717 RepID=UPI001E2EE72F|nr:hypothetical protein [Photobacterium carnosum]MCD9544896.1 hypothetical protein [Photobacterium carnosum]
MEPITTSAFTMGVLSGIVANYGTDLISAIFKPALKLEPELQKSLDNAQTLNDIEDIFTRAIGVIDASAASGELTINGAFLDAVKGIRFNHADGTVNIGNTSIKSEVLVTGGGANATGRTHITENTTMSSKGTSISLGNGCSIVMTGGASIHQS